MKKYVSNITATLVVAMFLAACGRGESTENEFSESGKSVAKYTALLASAADQSESYYAALASALNDAEGRVEELCKVKSARTLLNAQNAWKEVMDKYAAVEMVRFGPLRSSSSGQSVGRHLRFQTWPVQGTKAKVESAVAKLVTGDTGAELNADTLSRRPTQFQGIDVVEYLLFGKGSRNVSCFSGESVASECVAERTCEYLLGATKNLNNIAADVSQEWHESYSEAFRFAGNGSPVFVDAQSAVSELYGAIAEQLRRIRDKKLGEPLNAEAQIGAPTKLEAWRSRYTLNIIKKNLEALQDIYTGGTGSGADDILIAESKKEVDAEFKKALEKAIADADSLLSAPGFSGLYTELSGASPDKSRVTVLHQSVSDVVTIVEQKVMPALSITDTFNEDDGD